jgi:hypothetical protein
MTNGLSWSILGDICKVDTQHEYFIMKGDATTSATDAETDWYQAHLCCCYYKCY